MASARGLEPGARLRLITSIALAGLILATWFYYVSFFYYGRTDYPASTPLFNPIGHLHDFIDASEDARSLDPYRRSSGVYFPFAYLAMAPFFAFKGLPSFLLYFAVFLGFLGGLIQRSLRTVPGFTVKDLLVLTLTTYPVLFLLDRGNIEGLVFVFLAGAVWIRATRPRAGLFLLACATSMKAYPIVFLVLFLQHRPWRKLAEFGLACAGLTLAGLLLFKSSIVGSVQLLRANLAGFTGPFAASHSALLHNSSLFGALRIVAGLLRPGPFHESAAVAPLIENLHLGFSLLWLVVAGGAALRPGRPLWQRTFLLCSLFWLVPKLSFDYRLIHLYIPLLLYLTGGEGRPGGSRFDRAYCVLFGMLLIPWGYWVIGDEVTSASLFTPLLLLAISGIILADGEKSRPAR